MRKRLIITAVLVGTILIAYLLLYDYLPPRTPIKVARIHSGLKISKATSIVDFKENYTFTGEGEVEIKLKLNISELESIKEECLKSDYKLLNLDNLITDGFLDTNPQYGFNMPQTDLRNIKNGYYLLRATDLEKLDFTMTVLDIDKKELNIWTLIP